MNRRIRKHLPTTERVSVKQQLELAQSLLPPLAPLLCPCCHRDIAAQLTEAELSKLLTVKKKRRKLASETIEANRARKLRHQLNYKMFKTESEQSEQSEQP